MKLPFRYIECVGREMNEIGAGSVIAKCGLGGILRVVVTAIRNGVYIYRFHSL